MFECVDICNTSFSAIKAGRFTFLQRRIPSSANTYLYSRWLYQNNFQTLSYRRGEKEVRPPPEKDLLNKHLPSSFAKVLHLLDTDNSSPVIYGRRMDPTFAVKTIEVRKAYNRHLPYQQKSISYRFFTFILVVMISRMTWDYVLIIPILTTWPTWHLYPLSLFVPGNYLLPLLINAITYVSMYHCFFTSKI